jgi:Carboxypeptidase regulatory-like domain/TonB dependent receptor-like, beta-barrel
MKCFHPVALISRWLLLAVLLLSAFVGLQIAALAQSNSATLSGAVTDPNNAVVAGAHVTVTNNGTGLKREATTGASGTFVIPLLPPSIYTVLVENQGFTPAEIKDVTLNVGDNVALNIQLKVGQVGATVDVKSDVPLVDESGSVGTVIDRQLVGNLPLNGRSFNTLLQLTPGVVIAPSSINQPGQFSINGQRTDSNYFQVDGVSANFGVTPQRFLFQGGNGGGQAFNAFGGTSSLVSVDALQEFRVETSSFAPEFGRTPGGQVMITTRSGTNDFHGSAFDYFRNDVLDANDWFNNSVGKPRGAERQNDFGGVLGGPILRDKTFFFFSSESLRLLQPQTTRIVVPSTSTRASAVAASAPILNSYPLPDSGGPVFANGTAQFTGSYSNRITSDAVSVRIDHTFKNGLGVFGRFNWSPSQSLNRVNSLSNIQKTDVNTKTLTFGLNQQISSRLSNSLRFNYSKQSSGTVLTLDSFGGAQPVNSTLLLPSPFSLNESLAQVVSFDTAVYQLGRLVGNTESQFNIVDDFSVIKGTHQLKLGVDYRRLALTQSGSPITATYIYFSTSGFATTGNLFISSFGSFHNGKVSFKNVSTYAQDNWSVSRRLTLTYGLRWDVNPTPSPENGTLLSSWLNVSDPLSIALAPFGTPVYKTTYLNFAPRIGVAYRMDKKGNLVIRGGWGIFYDSGAGIVPTLLAAFPNQASSLLFGGQLPVPNFAAHVPVFSTQCPCSGVHAIDPALKLPYSYQWNVALDKSLGGRQAISVTYLGQAGRRLRRDELFSQATTNLPFGFELITNASSSNYNALQVQYRRPLYRRLQALANYTWSRSTDTASDDIGSQVPNLVSPAGSDRGPSSFDVRHNFTGTLTYDLPSAKANAFLKRVTENWSVGGVWQARSGFPILIFTTDVTGLGTASARPDLVPGVPIWIPDPSTGPGKKLNPSAFVVPSTTRQGNLPRNSIYGLGANQVDLSMQRAFTITEKIHLSFRMDAFNILNHPNFANPSGQVGNGTFGTFTQMLNRGLGGLNPLYQIGGPRSLQLSLRLAF